MSKEEEKNYHLKEINSRKGRGLFASKNFDKNDVIFEEKSLVNVQESSNRYEALVCNHCHAFLGHKSHQIQFLSKTINYQDLISNLLEEKAIVQCQCGQLYCGNQCYHHA